VVAVVRSRRKWNPQRPEERQRASGVAQPCLRVAGDPQRAEAVEQDVDGHAGATTLGEGIDEGGGHAALVPEVLLVGDRAPCATDGVELGRKDLVAVEQHVDRVTLHDGCVGVSFQRAGNGRVLDGERRYDPGRPQLRASGDDERHARQPGDPANHVTGTRSIRASACIDDTADHTAASALLRCRCEGG
jgi:hypothetical protein